MTQATHSQHRVFLSSRDSNACSNLQLEPREHPVFDKKYLQGALPVDFLEGDPEGVDASPVPACPVPMASREVVVGLEETGAII